MPEQLSLRSSRRGRIAFLCVGVLLCAAAAGLANQEQKPNLEKITKVLNKSPWVVGVWGAVGVDTGNPGIDALAREEQRRNREVLEQAEKTNPALAGASIYERTQDLHRLAETAGNTANIKRTPPPLAVRWISATSMLEAIRQIKQPLGPSKTGDLEKLFTLSRQFYAIAIGEGDYVATGGPVILKPVEDFELAGELLTQAYLTLPDGHKIAPAAVQLLSLGMFQPTPVFLFPRTVNGEPAIAPSVQVIGFHFHKLDVKFNLSKMTSEKKPDF